MDTKTTPRPRFRRLLAVPMLLLAIAALAGPAAAKEGAEAWFDTPIDLGAEPGSAIDVGWSVVVVAGEERSPMIGSPVFIRLVPPAGSGEAVTEFGTERPSGSGHYVASIIVPAGGIAGIEVGLRGSACTNGACETTDILFTLTGDALVGGVAADMGTASSTPTPSEGTGQLAWLVAIGVAAALGGGAAARLVGRRSIGQRV